MIQYVSMREIVCDIVKYLSFARMIENVLFSDAAAPPSFHNVTEPRQIAKINNYHFACYWIDRLVVSCLNIEFNLSPNSSTAILSCSRYAL